MRKLIFSASTHITEAVAESYFVATNGVAFAAGTPSREPNRRPSCYFAGYIFWSRLDTLEGRSAPFPMHVRTEPVSGTDGFDRHAVNAAPQFWLALAVAEPDQLDSRLAPLPSLAPAWGGPPKLDGAPNTTQSRIEGSDKLNVELAPPMLGHLSPTPMQCVRGHTGGVPTLLIPLS